MMVRVASTKNAGFRFVLVRGASKNAKVFYAGPGCIYDTVGAQVVQRSAVLDVKTYNACDHTEYKNKLTTTGNHYFLLFLT